MRFSAILAATASVLFLASAVPIPSSGDLSDDVFARDDEDFVALYSRAKHPEKNIQFLPGAKQQLAATHGDDRAGYKAAKQTDRNAVQAHMNTFNNGRADADKAHKATISAGSHPSASDSRNHITATLHKSTGAGSGTRIANPVKVDGKRTYAHHIVHRDFDDLFARDDEDDLFARDDEDDLFARDDENLVELYSREKHPEKNIQFLQGAKDQLAANHAGDRAGYKAAKQTDRNAVQAHMNTFNNGREDADKAHKATISAATHPSASDSRNHITATLHKSTGAGAGTRIANPVKVDGKRTYAHHIVHRDFDDDLFARDDEDLVELYSRAKHPEKNIQFLQGAKDQLAATHAGDRAGYKAAKQTHRNAVQGHMNTFNNGREDANKAVKATISAPQHVSGSDSRQHITATLHKSTGAGAGTRIANPVQVDGKRTYAHHIHT